MSKRAPCVSFASINLANGLHLVSPGSWFMSSISATSISGLRAGVVVTEMTSDDMESILTEDSAWLVVGRSCLSGVAGKRVPFVIGRVDGMFGVGSRTLMVTLLGVRSADGDIVVISVCLEDVSPRGGVNEARALPGSDGVG